MSARILDGKKIAETLLNDIQQQVAQLDKSPPGLAVILLGEDPASQIYVRNKRLACEKIGMHSVAYDLPQSTSQKKLLELIEQLNRDPQINGILVQLPLPQHIDSNAIVDHITPEKDVDGFHPYNLGRLVQQRPLLRPCTPYGIITLLQRSNIEIAGIDAVVVGASNVVGRPMALELLMAKCTVTICHSATQDLAMHVRHADLLIVAIGQPNIIETEWIKPGAIIIDVGISRSPDGKIIGDIDFETAKHKASWITPVPGGVGPMTVAMLLQNTLLAAKN